MGTLYLLDTNILVHFVRDSRVWRRIEGRYSILLRDPTPIISTITIGELVSFGRRNGWGPHRRAQADYICAHLRPVLVGDRPLYEAYAAIEAFTRGHGRPMGDNDIWIAATARSNGATILTTDRDFGHLAPALVQVEWFDPTLPAGGTP